MTTPKTPHMNPRSWRKRGEYWISFKIFSNRAAHNRIRVFAKALQKWNLGEKQPQCIAVVARQNMLVGRSCVKGVSHLSYSNKARDNINRAYYLVVNEQLLNEKNLKKSGFALFLIFAALKMWTWRMKKSRSPRNGNTLVGNRQMSLVRKLIRKHNGPNLLEVTSELP